MIHRSTTDEVLEELRNLGEAERRRVLKYARRLSSEPSGGTSGKDLMKHFGVMSDEDAGEIARAIEEGCERINEDAW